MALEVLYYADDRDRVYGTPTSVTFADEDEGAAFARRHQGDVVQVRDTLTGLDLSRGAWLQLGLSGSPQLGATVLARLEALGSAVNQGMAETLEERWLQFIREAGSASPPSNFNYLGGDVTDAFITPSGDRAWIFADGFDGTTVVTGGPDPDTYAGPALPVRNGVVLEDVSTSTFTVQLYATGSSGIWLDAVSQGGLPAGTHWWPITGINDGGVSRVFCWHVRTDSSPYGTLLDSHIVRLNAFGGYNSHVETGLGALTDNFWTDGVVRDTDAGFTYVFGEQFVPDYDADQAGSGAVPNYGQGSLSSISSHFTLKRVARVPNGQLTTVANWTYWNGTTWVSGVENAVPLVDTNGYPIHGDAGVSRLPTGRFLLAAHTLVDTHVNVYDAAEVQGPYRLLARVPALTQGSRVDNGGVQIGQLAKVLSPDVAAPDPTEQHVVLLSRNVLDGPGTTAGQNIRRFAPQLVFVPTQGQVEELLV